MRQLSGLFETELSLCLGIFASCTAYKSVTAAPNHHLESAGYGVMCIKQSSPTLAPLQATPCSPLPDTCPASRLSLHLTFSEPPAPLCPYLLYSSQLVPNLRYTYHTPIHRYGYYKHSSLPIPQLSHRVFSRASSKSPQPAAFLSPHSEPFRPLADNSAIQQSPANHPTVYSPCHAVRKLAHRPEERLRAIQTG